MEKKEYVKKPITMAEAKEILGKIDLEEADQIQKRTIDYLDKFTKVNAEAAIRIKEKLVREVGLTEEEAIEIINIRPSYLGELNAIISGWRKLISTEKKNLILRIVKEEKNKGE